MEIRKKLHRSCQKYPFVFILLGYFLVNIFFMHSFWNELIFDNSKVGARYGEVFSVEFTMDKVYQNIINGRNPFAYSNALLYPFGTNFLSTDSGNGFFFVFLRPFLSEHQSLSVLVASGLIFANLGMYLLLRKLGFDKFISFLIGLAYGNMTFLMARVGHLTYMPIYVFPWFFYSGYSILRERQTSKKIVFTLLASLFLVLSLYLNQYYFVMLALSIGLIIGYYLFFDRKYLFSSFISNWKYLICWLVFTSILLYPWVVILLQTIKFEELPAANGWGGAIQFSSDLFNFFIPGTYSYFLNPIAVFLATRFKFASGIFENFTYPGIIIIFSFITLFILKLKNKLPYKLYLSIKPYLFVAVIFLVLTLGPFLHVFGKWGITVDEGIRIVFPLPYIVFHYIPFLANIRVPGRLIVGFIFFAYIVCAYLIDYFLRNKSSNFKKSFLALFLLVFFIDHYFSVNTPSRSFFPNKLYEEIKKDPSKITVMEVPSTVRDGFTYLGNPDALGFIVGQLKHGKPVLGGYFGRVPYFKVDYYKRNPFLGYTGRLMDPDLKNNGSLDKTDIEVWKSIDLEKSSDAINFLDLKYFLLDEQEPYVATLSSVLQNLGFSKKMNEENYSLWQRIPEKTEFLSVDIGSKKDDMYLGMGWGLRESGFRWAGKKSSILFKLNNPRKFILNFQASAFYNKQEVKIYVNKKEIAKVTVPTHLEKFSIPINQELTEGINFIHFIFPSSYRPSAVIPSNNDNRNLSARFTHVSLDETQ